jgi:hypothetical protein
VVVVGKLVGFVVVEGVLTEVGGEVVAEVVVGGVVPEGLVVVAAGVPQAVRIMQANKNPQE